MRLGVVIDGGTIPAALAPVLAELTERAGLDLVWWRSSAPRSTLALAASCARVDGLVVGAEVVVDDTHPLYLAEERNVVDQLLGGRLVVGLRSSGRRELDREWLQVLLAAGAPAPFRHEGPHFTVPAGLPENRINPERQVRVTPAPFSLEPQVWLLDAPELAGRYGISPLVGATTSAADAERQWAALAADLAERAARLRRPGVRTWDPATTDAAALAIELRAERDRWGLDTLALDLPMEPGSAEWTAALAELAGVVRPRLQAHTLPPGLEEFWDDLRTTRRETNEREVTT